MLGSRGHLPAKGAGCIPKNHETRVCWLRRWFDHRVPIGYQNGRIMLRFSVVFQE